MRHVLHDLMNALTAQAKLIPNCLQRHTTVSHSLYLAIPFSLCRHFGVMSIFNSLEAFPVSAIMPFLYVLDLLL